MEVSISATEPASRVAIACRDIVDGVRAYPVWSTLGWQDIRQRYRRSALGPFWITLTMLVTIAGMGPLYGALLKQDVHDFVPYLALGIITWGLISTLILEGGGSFYSVRRYDSLGASPVYPTYSPRNLSELYYFST